MKYQKEFEEFMCEQNPIYWTDRHFQIVGDSYAIRELSHSYPVFEAMYEKVLLLKEKINSRDLKDERKSDELETSRDVLHNLILMLKSENEVLSEALKKAIEQKPVGITVEIPGITNVTFAAFESDKVPPNTQLFIRPIGLPNSELLTEQLEQILCDLKTGPHPAVSLACTRIEKLLERTSE